MILTYFTQKKLWFFKKIFRENSIRNNHHFYSPEKSLGKNSTCKTQYFDTQERFLIKNPTNSQHYLVRIFMFFQIIKMINKNSNQISHVKIPYFIQPFDVNCRISTSTQNNFWTFYVNLTTETKTIAEAKNTLDDPLRIMNKGSLRLRNLTTDKSYKLNLVINLKAQAIKISFWISQLEPLAHYWMLTLLPLFKRLKLTKFQTSLIKTHFSSLDFILS